MPAGKPVEIGRVGALGMLWTMSLPEIKEKILDHSLQWSAHTTRLRWHTILRVRVLLCLCSVTVALPQAARKRSDLFRHRLTQS